MRRGKVSITARFKVSIGSDCGNTLEGPSASGSTTIGPKT
jgi:hypothetical protein